MAASCIPNQGNVYAFNRNLGIEIIVARGKSASFSTHTHISTLNILLMRSGRIRFFADANERDIKAGDTVIIQPHQAHRLQTADQFSMVTLSLHCSLFAPTRPIEQCRSIQEFLNAMIRFGHLSVLERTAFLQAMEKVSIKSHNSDDSLSRLRQSLEDNPEYSISLDEMAQTAHMEKGHLIRRFKKRYGITPHCFVTQNRIRMARRHLLGNNSLTESALMAGFYDQSHFIRNFKKLHGLTPTEYLLAARPMQA